MYINAKIANEGQFKERLEISENYYKQAITVTLKPDSVKATNCWKAV